ncbi:MAG: ABC transporter substrate-binding protein [Bacteroidetes bacterium]|nr:ABC transporter substrate-binding protein [Rhodothermia bacterium]MCS7154702.1 ABC transporter substrate-binding protein [Bacteroidota bacterium]MCX7907141.1 ABC transporter substrate-binding protein [Bacteroidota bacterium]MDW8137495.1 ABC transporter substrate-binding protein [Bacteroidota bacterium]MDW8285551.1 ABC transporter substrate-binding protein [Bacteroidota bacterium]
MLRFGWGFRTALLLLGAVSVARGQGEEARVRALLEARDRQIKAILGPQGASYSSEQRERLKGVLTELMDFEAMARVALGPWWERISAAERTQFVSAFRRVIEENSLKNLDIYRARVAYEGIRVVGDSAYVQTRAALERTSARVDYVLRKRGAAWVIVDYVLDGVSTAQSYRRSFEPVLRSRGFHYLLERLQRRARPASS